MQQNPLGLLRPDPSWSDGYVLDIASYSFLRDLLFWFLELLAPVGLPGLAACSVLPVATSELWAYGTPC